MLCAWANPGPGEEGWPRYPRDRHWGALEGSSVSSKSSPFCFTWSTCGLSARTSKGRPGDAPLVAKLGHPSPALPLTLTAPRRPSPTGAGGYVCAGSGDTTGSPGDSSLATVCPGLHCTSLGSHGWVRLGPATPPPLPLKLPCEQQTHCAPAGVWAGLGGPVQGSWAGQGHVGVGAAGLLILQPDCGQLCGGRGALCPHSWERSAATFLFLTWHRGFCGGLVSLVVRWPGGRHKEGL